MVLVIMLQKTQTALEEKLFNSLLYKHKHATISIVYINQRRDSGLLFISFVVVYLQGSVQSIKAGDLFSVNLGMDIKKQIDTFFSKLEVKSFS